MSEWDKFRLGDAMTVKHGFAFKGEYFRDTGSLIVLTPGNFYDAGGFKAKSGVEKFYAGPVPVGYMLVKGDVVVAMTEQAHGLLGSSATIPENDTYLHNQRIGLIRITNSDRLDLRFVYHLLNADCVRTQLQATATGSKVRHTAPERIENVEALVPGVGTQSRVARVLDSIDNLIGNNRRRIALLEQMAEGVYREWFVHFRYPGHEDDHLVDSPQGALPAGWEIRHLQDVTSPVVDSVDPADVEPDTPAVGLEHIPRRSFTLVDWGRADDLASRKTRFVAGDVLFGKIRPYFHKVCVAPNDGICSTDAIVVRPNNPRLHGLVAMTMFSDEFVAHAVATSNGTKMPRADWKVLRMWTVPIPPEPILDSFGNLVTAVIGLCEVLARQNRQLAAFRDLLLPRLITGELDISGLDVGELPERVPT